MGKPEILLASASPRRRELLEQIGVDYRLVRVDVPEAPAAGESPEEFVLRVSLDKARAGREALHAAGAPGADLALPVLGADTAVVLDRDVLGKPRDREDAMAMLERLSGRTHTVLTGVALVREREATRLSVNRVTFRSISPAERTAYCDRGEALDKAGSYGIQGLAAVFISRVEGSYSGVMGLPLFETAELLNEFGIELL